MPKEYFKLENAASLASLRKGGKIHVIGVCGVAMAQLSVALADLGYEVSGSDKEFYEPMGSFLRSSKVKLCEGYKAEHVPQDAGLVMIGNAVSYGHPEVGVVEERGLPYTLFPKLLAETLIGEKRSIVVTGTHGKTTTTALIASILSKLGEDPSYFVGGIAKDLPRSLAVGSGKYSVVEGDEYDSAFFAKVPKFRFYKPQSCVINAIEYDHADIYPTLESVVKEFEILLDSLPPGADVAACVDFPEVKKICKARAASRRIMTFGQDAESEHRIVSRRFEGDLQVIELSSAGAGSSEIRIPVYGTHNARNAVAAFLICRGLGLDEARVLDAMSTFQAVKRRQEIRFSGGGVVLIEDFAHHPTAVRETLAAIREAYPKKRLWALYEPRSNTSRRKVFQEAYVSAFGPADRVLICDVAARSIDADQELLDTRTLADSIAKNGQHALCLPDAKAIQDYVMREVSGNDAVVLMSNGSFGGLPQSLTDAFRASA